MKTASVLTIMVVCTLAHAVSAQEKIKTWIFLQDKLTAAGKTTQVESSHLSADALERRSRRGRPVAPVHDAPISPLYLNALAAEGIEVVHHSRWLNAVTAYLGTDEIDAVQQLPFVRKTQPVARLSAHDVKPILMPQVLAQPQSRRLHCGPSCTQLRLVNAIDVMDNGIYGQGIKVGFVDTRFDYNGVQLGHPATEHLANADRVKFMNFTADDPGVGSSQDFSFHGLNTTTVTFGAAPHELYGPCYGADTVYAAQTEWAPLERNVEEDNFVAGVEWMEANGVDVINSSLGYDTFDSGEQRNYTQADMDGDTGITTIAFDMAAERGVVPVASAGNSGNNTSWRIISTPADGDSVIAAGGTNSTGVHWSSSSHGNTADGRIKPDVSAQGAGVRVGYSNGGYGHANGTSFSAPMITGIVCQILQVNPDLNPKEVWEVLTNTASQATSPDSLLGWGIANAGLAVDSARARIPVSVTPEAPLPGSFVVRSPYPNPFHSEAHLELDLAQPSASVRVILRNLLGQRIRVPFAGPLGAGTHTISVSADGLPAGVYTYVVESDGRTHTGLMVLVR